MQYGLRVNGKDVPLTLSQFRQLMHSAAFMLDKLSRIPHPMTADETSVFVLVKDIQYDMYEFNRTKKDDV